MVSFPETACSIMAPTIVLTNSLLSDLAAPARLSRDTEVIRLVITEPKAASRPPSLRSRGFLAGEAISSPPLEILFRKSITDLAVRLSNPVLPNNSDISTLLPAPSVTVEAEFFIARSRAATAARPFRLSPMSTNELFFKRTAILSSTFPPIMAIELYLDGAGTPPVISMRVSAISKLFACVACARLKADTSASILAFPKDAVLARLPVVFRTVSRLFCAPAISL